MNDHTRVVLARPEQRHSVPPSSLEPARRRPPLRSSSSRTPRSRPAPQVGHPRPMPPSNASSSPTARLRDRSHPKSQVRHEDHRDDVDAFETPSPWLGTSVHVAGQVRTSQTGKKIIFQLRELDADGAVIQKFDGVTTPSTTGWNWTGATLSTTRTNSRVNLFISEGDVTATKYLQVRAINSDVTPPAPRRRPRRRLRPRHDTDTPADPATCADIDYSKSGQGRQVFGDEFNGSAVDTAKWRVRDGESLSFDKARILARNVTVHDGVLDIAGKARDRLQPRLHHRLRRHHRQVQPEVRPLGDASQGPHRRDHDQGRLAGVLAPRRLHTGRDRHHGDLGLTQPPSRSTRARRTRGRSGGTRTSAVPTSSPDGRTPKATHQRSTTTTTCTP